MRLGQTPDGKTRGSRFVRRMPAARHGRNNGILMPMLSSHRVAKDADDSGDVNGKDRAQEGEVVDLGMLRLDAHADVI